jgi:phosphate:Na+ symporter
MTIAALIPTTWGVLSVLSLLGGLGLFLWGLEELSTSMKTAAGNGLKALLGRLTRTRLAGLGLGLMVTLLLQSSSATTVILVSLVEAQLLAAGRTVAVIMGANIGTTFTGQLIAFKLTDYSLAMLAIGLLVRTVLRPGRGRELAGVIIGLGLLFFGLGIMSEAMRPLRSSPVFRDLVASAASLPVGLLVGAVFTAVVQSSSATTGIVIGLASQGLVPLEVAIPVLLGANLGTCVTAWLASLKASAAAKRVALGHILFNLAGIAIFAGWVPAFAQLVRAVSIGIYGPNVDVARQIANAHTIFNVVASLALLPLSPLLVKLTEKLLPAKDEPRPFPPLEPGLVDRLARAPDLALVRSRQALRLLGRALASEIEALEAAFVDGEPLAEARRRSRIEQCRGYVNDLGRYQAAILQLPMTPGQIAQSTSQALVLANLEPIARSLELDALPLGQRVARARASFSEEGREELRRFSRAAADALRESLAALVQGDRDRAHRAVELKAKLRREMATAQRRHIERVREGLRESLETDRLHMEILDLHRLILAHAGRIAEALLEEE